LPSVHRLPAAAAALKHKQRPRLHPVP